MVVDEAEQELMCRLRQLSTLQSRQLEMLSLRCAGLEKQPQLRRNSASVCTAQLVAVPKSEKKYGSVAAPVLSAHVGTAELQGACLGEDRRVLLAELDDLQCRLLNGPAAQHGDCELAYARLAAQAVRSRPVACGQSVDTTGVVQDCDDDM